MEIRCEKNPVAYAVLVNAFKICFHSVSNFIHIVSTEWIEMKTFHRTEKSHLTSHFQHSIRLSVPRTIQVGFDAWFFQRTSYSHFNSNNNNNNKQKFNFNIMLDANACMFGIKNVLFELLTFCRLF